MRLDVGQSGPNRTGISIRQATYCTLRLTCFVTLATFTRAERPEPRIELDKRSFIDRFRNRVGSQDVDSGASQLLDNLQDEAGFAALLAKEDPPPPAEGGGGGGAHLDYKEILKVIAEHKTTAESLPGHIGELKGESAKVKEKADAYAKNVKELDEGLAAQDKATEHFRKLAKDQEDAKMKEVEKIMGEGGEGGGGGNPEGKVIAAADPAHPDAKVKDAGKVTEDQAKHASDLPEKKASQQEIQQVEDQVKKEIEDHGHAHNPDDHTYVEEKLRVTLVWEGAVDLDLYMECPPAEGLGESVQRIWTGDIIYWNSMTVGKFGLDVDDRGFVGGRHQESISELHKGDQIPDGTYKVFTKYFAGKDKVTFKGYLNLPDDTDGDMKVSGEMTFGQVDKMFEFEMKDQKAKVITN